MPDPTLVELFKQLPISVALLLVLLYFIRTNRQDRHELNIIAEKQAATEAANIANTGRLIDRTEAFEATLSGLTARVTGQQSVLEEMRNLNKSLVASTQQSVELAGNIRTREEAKLASKEEHEKFEAVVEKATGPILDGIKMHLGEKDLTHRRLETIHTLVSTQAVDLQKLNADVQASASVINTLPPHLDALKLKMDDWPTLVKETFAALVSERDGLKVERDHAVQELEVMRTANARLTGDLMAKDHAVEKLNETIRVQNATIAALPKPLTEGKGKPDVKQEPLSEPPTPEAQP